ncbi:DMSO/selenate family reductase complex B subunit [Rubeoparvulum massiliense]|uniref:DMSO/selenate family reductase complex B subunit n=1 Tax=Rubeoparvulum massiliense TaxID=1631346 RepID=UPI00065E9423|nr:DMSO/selenate family reductase complex B subunit [Rubeoparvulum massiliense]
MGKQLGFYIEQNRCIGCRACQVACKDKNDLEVGVLFRKVKEVEYGSFVQQGDAYLPNVGAYYISISCNHCTDPKCVENCPTGAMYKREEDGVVLVNPDVCVGCRYCTMACPYGAPQFIEELGQVRKCNFCLELIANGEQPACVGACPTRCIHYGPIDELREKFGGTADLYGLPSSEITHPNILFNPHKDAKH